MKSLSKVANKRNDILRGLNVKIKGASVGSASGVRRTGQRIVLGYAGAYGRGYDGCGSHTHQG